MNHRPVAIGLLLCEQVIVEEGTRNVTPVGCFGLRELDEFPGAVSFIALAWLADGEGEMVTELSVQRLDTLEVIYRDEMTLKFPGRLRETRFMARIRDCNFPTAGQYAVSLIVGGEFIAHRRLRVRQRGGS